MNILRSRDMNTQSMRSCFMLAKQPHDLPRDNEDMTKADLYREFLSIKTIPVFNNYSNTINQSCLKIYDLFY